MNAKLHGYSQPLTWIGKVEIKNLWGFKEVGISFNHDLNVMIGKNGTGKTTILKLMNAALTADVSVLESVEFDLIAILIQTFMQDGDTVIIVERVVDENGKAVFKFKAEGGISAEFSVESTWLRGMIPQSSKLGEELNENRIGPKGHDYKSKVSKLLPHLWLPVNRLNSQSLNDFQSKSEIDAKIKDSITRLERLYASLSLNMYESLKQNRAKAVSLLLSGWMSNFNGEYLPSTMSELELSEAIKEIETSMTFGGDLALDLSSIITNYRKLVSSNKPLDGMAAIVFKHILATLRESLKSEDATPVAVQHTMRMPAYALNEFFTNKVAMLDSNQSLVFGLRNQKGDFVRTISPYELSAGEKQLLLIILEYHSMFFTNGTFIVDEPELSIHVEWQDKLVGVLSKLNSSVQIIAATHSPDILSIYQDKVHVLGD